MIADLSLRLRTRGVTSGVRVDASKKGLRRQRPPRRPQTTTRSIASTAGSSAPWGGGTSARALRTEAFSRSRPKRGVSRCGEPGPVAGPASAPPAESVVGRQSPRRLTSENFGLTGVQAMAVLVYEALPPAVRGAPVIAASDWLAWFAQTGRGLRDGDFQLGSHA